MAINISLKQINFAKKNSFGKLYSIKKNNFIVNKIINYLLMIIYYLKIELINLKRKLVKNFCKTHSDNGKNVYHNISILNNRLKINTISSELKKNNFFFIENFLDKKFYTLLKKYWPNNNFFVLNSNIIKSYSIGFRYSKDFGVNVKNVLDLKNFYFLKKLYLYLNSKNFQKFIDSITGTKNSYELHSIMSTTSTHKSFLAPHVDGIFNKTKKKVYNVILFIDGNNDFPEYSGGTGIYRINDFKNPLLIPFSLKNTALIYTSTKKFFHGHKLIKKEGFRKALTFQIFPKNLK